MICAGCGQELPARGPRGRPARFHNAACRQRAHRARRASRHNDILAAIAGLEATVSELRRTVLTGADTAEASHRLARAFTALSDLVPDSAPNSPPPLPQGQALTRLPGPPAPRVTEPVTERTAKSQLVEQQPQRLADPAARRKPPEARQSQSVTKPITKRDRPPRIDPSTVRVERNRDDYGPTWRVLGGDTDNPTLIGYVESARTISGNRSTNRWIVTTSSHTPLNRRARNRTEAVAVLLDSYLRAAGAR